MSWSFSNSSSNSSSNFYLTGTTGDQVGTATLSGCSINTFGFLSRFQSIFGTTVGGQISYNWYDGINNFGVNVVGASNTLQLQLNGSNLTTQSNVTWTNSNSIGVRYVPSLSNTAIKVYVSDVLKMNYITNTVYQLSNIAHKWSGCNWTLSNPKLIINPSVENVMCFDNAVQFQDSILVGKCITTSNIVASNVSVNSINATTYNNLPSTANYTGFSNWISPLVSSGASITASNITASGQINSTLSMSAPYMSIPSRLYTPSLEWTGGAMYFYSSNYVISTNNATNALNIVNNGRVGIGVTNPSQSLHTSGNAQLYNGFIGDVGHSVSWAGFAHSSSANTTGYAVLQNASGNTLINSQSGQSINFRISNGDKAIMDSSGNWTMYGSLASTNIANGSYTMTFSGYSGGLSAVAMSIPSAWSRIGNCVTVLGNLSLTGYSSSFSFTIAFSGLPTIATSLGSTCIINFNGNGGSSCTVVNGTTITVTYNSAFSTGAYQFSLLYVST